MAVGCEITAGAEKTILGGITMAVLECNVVTCAHNSDDKCCRGEIKVDGPDAANSASTCCCSYDECGCGCKNETKCPDRTVEINCSAVNCVYNDSEVCKATLVGMVGHSAKNSKETECATFKHR